MSLDLREYLFKGEACVDQLPGFWRYPAQLR